MYLIPSTPEQIELKYWIFRLHHGPFYVRIQGYRKIEGDFKQKCWITSPISYCENARTIVTISGRRYVLANNIDTDQALIYQYPDFLIDLFKDGFPENWERLLRPLHQMMNLTDMSMISPFLCNKFWKITDDVLLKNENKQASKIKKEKVVKGCRELVPIAKTVGGLSITRSGRVIKPRLQTWEGERISYDVYGNAILAHSAITRAPNKPDYSARLATICDGLGVSRLESSKQTHRISALFDTPQMVKKKSKGRISNNSSKKRKIVDYSSSEDSFMAAVDTISLSSSPEGSVAELTPIRFKATNSKRIIQSTKRPTIVNFKEKKKVKVNKKPKKLPKPQNKVISPPKIKKVIAVPVIPKKTPKKKKWSADDSKRLKIALKAAVNPKTDEDWETIARSVSGGRWTGAECREHAIKIRWKLSKISNTPDEQNKQDKNKKKGRSLGGKDNADFFVQKKYNISLLDLDPNDSLLSVLNTPKEEAKFIRKPFIMQQVLNDTRRSVQSNENFDETC